MANNFIILLRWVIFMNIFTIATANIVCNPGLNNSLSCVHSGGDYEFLEGISVDDNARGSMLSLYLSNCKIVQFTSSTFAGMSSLIFLDMSDNGIRELRKNSFQHLIELKTLDLSRNLLMYVDPQVLEPTPKLKVLDLADNLIFLYDNRQTLLLGKSIHTLLISSNNRDINYVLQRSQLESRVMSSEDDVLVKRLLDVYFKKSSTREVALPSCTKIDLSNNLISKVTRINPESSPTYSWVNLSFNALTYLEKRLVANTKLFVVDLRSNQIKKLDDDFFSGANFLLYLDLSQNSFETLHPNFIARCRPLKYFNASHNFITNIDANFFSNNQRLVAVSLGSNKIKNIPENLFVKNKELQRLDLSHNQIETFSQNTFRELISLKYIDISNNVIKNIYSGLFLNNPNLVYFDVSFNKMEKIPEVLFATTPNVRCVNFRNNEINDAPSVILKSLPVLQRVDLSNNKLAFLDDSIFENNPELELVDLNRNYLDNIGYNQFKTNPKLKEIFLMQNNLQDFPFHNIDSLQQLRRLHLNWNQFYDIDPRVMHLNSLIELSLSCNIFTGISLDFVRGATESLLGKRRVFIHGNPWRCSCINRLSSLPNKFIIFEAKGFSDGKSPSCIIETRDDECDTGPPDDSLYNKWYEQLQRSNISCNGNQWRPMSNLDICEFNKFEINYHFFNITNH